MLYRQRMMLALIEAFGGRIDKLYLQKLLFLLSQRQERPAYEFVPYQYEPYSFTGQRDLHNSPTRSDTGRTIGLR
jgi:hypothetical protein